MKVMKSNEKILTLVAALIFTIVGYLRLEEADHNLLMVVMSFFAAAVLLYTYFGRKGISSFSFTQMNDQSKTLILGSETKEVSPPNNFKIRMVTFMTILALFGLGFGIGRLIYHLIH
ncbi:hypothetical protein [Flagellimonas allohymeniacidonis]|uniref:DUF3899 domain-containing protein n=1 Tax=Flagellimonas allohymeniacidonis TaxID=2517819 RepID=A0A4Q8QI79_9FLAO|nr:hypothetical protein [Allomuricauda hymeniacidonis]TAI49704.1 hypothetical protein EW142_07880 [Allomuricauda hymeniacidonis]